MAVRARSSPLRCGLETRWFPGLSEASDSSYTIAVFSPVCSGEQICTLAGIRYRLGKTYEDSVGNAPACFYLIFTSTQRFAPAATFTRVYRGSGLSVTLVTLHPSIWKSVVREISDKRREITEMGTSSPTAHGCSGKNLDYSISGRLLFTHQFLQGRLNRLGPDRVAFFTQVK